MKHEFIEHEKIKEPLCLELFKTCMAYQSENKWNAFTGISYKELMRRMHIGRDGLQHLLNCIKRNWLYFKIEHGYMVEVHNIVQTIEKSKRFVYDGKPFYHIKIKSYYRNKDDNRKGIQDFKGTRTNESTQHYNS